MAYGLWRQNHRSADGIWYMACGGKIIDLRIAYGFWRQNQELESVLWEDRMKFVPSSWFSVLSIATVLAATLHGLNLAIPLRT